MSLDLLNAYYSLPSVKDFLASSREVLEEKRSLILLLPVQVDINFVRQNIFDELWKREYNFQHISLADFNKNERPLDFLINIFKPDCNCPDLARTITNFMDFSELPEIIDLTDINKCSLEDQKKWIDFSKSWSIACHQRANEGKVITSISLIVNAESLLSFLPENDLFLETRWWWGFPSVLESNLLCRLCNVNNWDFIGEWREKILPSLVCGDLSFYSSFWDLTGISFTDLTSRMRSNNLEANWDENSITQWEDFSNRNDHWSDKEMTLKPPNGVLSLWAKGLVYQTIEYGLEVHPSILALTGNLNELKHRLWRAQVQLLLPVLDELRLELCNHLTIKLGEKWPYQWDRPDTDEELLELQENPLATQWGYLAWLLKNNRYFTNYRHWSKLASTAQYLRNKIAHYKMISVDDYINLQQKITEFRQSK